MFSLIKKKKKSKLIIRAKRIKISNYFENMSHFENIFSKIYSFKNTLNKLF